MPHLVVMYGGFVCCGVEVCGLIDKPYFKCVVHGLVFMVDDADDECGVLSGGEVSGVVVCDVFWSEEVEFSEFFSCFWGDDDVDECCYCDEYGDDEDDGECVVEF